MVLSEEVKGELTQFVIRKFQELQDFTDDPKEISEYIVLLISNGRSADDILNELADLVTTSGLKDVIGSCFEALQQHEQQQQQLQQQEQLKQLLLQQQSQSQPQSQSQSQSQPLTSSSQQDPDSEMDADSNASPIPGRSIPTRPSGLAARIGSNGVSKRPNANGANGRNSAFKNTAAFEKALNLSGDSTFRMKKKGRCHKFPHCPHGRECLYAHPTKNCHQFPDCPNPPGTCNYLHPGQDDELIAELAKTKQAYLENKRENTMINKFVQQNTGISLCKFGILCTNPQCPFGHPNPVNEDAKVIKFEWCPENLKCTNPGCDKAHSSLSKIKPVQQSQPAQQQVERSLEACKFGSRCTNRYCKFRHAKSHILCRDGENCQRIDCLFTHPINEECRFGEGCKNPNCIFKHSNGKAAAASLPTGNLTWTNKTNERQFAVPDDQVLEQAPPQEE